MLRKVGQDNTTLLVLGAAYPSALSPVQLQKAVFLIQKGMEKAGCEAALPNQYKFEAYDYGPFCSGIYFDARNMADRGLVEMGTATGYRKSYDTYRATEKGMEAWNKLNDSCPETLSHYVHQVVDWVKAQSFASLLNSVYAQYPDMAKNSVFRK